MVKIIDQKINDLSKTLSISKIARIVKKSRAYVSRQIKKYLSKKEENNIKHKVIGLHLLGKSVNQISKLIPKSYKSIQRWVNKYELIGNIINRIKYIRKRRKLTSRKISLIKHLIDHDCSLSYNQVAVLTLHIKVGQ